MVERRRDWAPDDAAKKEVLEVADEEVARTKGQRVANDGPDNGDQAIMAKLCIMVPRMFFLRTRPP